MFLCTNFLFDLPSLDTIFDNTSSNTKSDLFTYFHVIQPTYFQCFFFKQCFMIIHKQTYVKYFSNYVHLWVHVIRLLHCSNKTDWRSQWKSYHIPVFYTWFYLNSWTNIIQYSQATILPSSVESVLLCLIVASKTCRTARWCTHIRHRECVHCARVCVCAKLSAWISREHRASGSCMCVQSATLYAIARFARARFASCLFDFC